MYPSKFYWIENPALPWQRQECFQLPVPLLGPSAAAGTGGIQGIVVLRQRLGGLKPSLLPLGACAAARTGGIHVVLLLAQPLAELPPLLLVLGPCAVTAGAGSSAESTHRDGTRRGSIADTLATR